MTDKVLTQKFCERLKTLYSVGRLPILKSEQASIITYSFKVSGINFEVVITPSGISDWNDYYASAGPVNLLECVSLDDTICAATLFAAIETMFNNKVEVKSAAEIIILKAIGEI